MDLTNFHKEFHFQERAFQTPEALLAFVESLSEESADFLKQWFDGNSYIDLQTSGATGIPKELRLSKQAMAASAKATGSFFGLGAQSTALLCLSPNYIAGKMMWVRALVLGWHLDLAPMNSNPLKNLTKSYDFAAMVPLQLNSSLKNLSMVKQLIVGGAPVSKDLERQLQKCSTEVYATYGMTETCSHIAVKKLNFLNTEYGSYYRTLPGVSIALDERACLTIAFPWCADSLLKTNDLVALHSPTEFEWLGRFDSVINSGGVKLIPEQIESKLAPCFDQRFFIAGIPDSILGQKVVLLLEGKGEKTASKQRIASLLKGVDLSKYELPKEIYYVPKFVETPTQKIQRMQTVALILE
tara:strand:- start:11647 stop:12711 length:1065 start_codon:yes stop_codon:yes gene_type:complete